MDNPVRLMLVDIRSAHNVGALFRTADAIRVEKLYLCGVTPLPIDRFGRAVGAITKTALGAEHTVAWEHVTDTLVCIKALKKEGWDIVAVEQDARAQDYKTYLCNKPTVLLLGEEVGGLTHDLLDGCDAIIEIPMRGKKESLNVSVAAGIVLYRLMDL